jgi:hypothetical protein
MNNKRSPEWWANNSPQSTVHLGNKSPLSGDKVATKPQTRRERLQALANSAAEAAKKGKEQGEREARERQNRPATRARGKDRERFVPTDEQRHVVGFLSGCRMSQEEICHLIVWPGTNKTICKETLATAFAVELASGKANVKKELLSEWLDVVRNGEDHARWRAIEFGLKVINGWRDDPAASVAMNINGDTGINKLSVEFVLPSGERFGIDTPPRPSIPHHHAPHAHHDARRDGNRAHQDAPASSPQRTRLTPEPTDLVLDKVQPSAFKAKRDGFNWE